MENLKHYLRIISKEVKESFIDNKYIILAITLLFLITTILGFFFAADLQNFMKPVVKTFEHRISSGQVTLTTHSLYYNNLLVTLRIYEGSFLMGVAGILEIIINALLIGHYGALCYMQGKLILYILLILPHGIFEIPALIISSSGGFVMLEFLILFLKNLISPDYSYTDVFDPIYNSDKISFIETVKMSWRKNGKMFKQSLILLLVAIILLMIAAFIEANITQPLALLIYKYFIGIL